MTDTGPSDPLLKCNQNMLATKAAYGSYTFPISECRACPFADGIYPAQCHLACGETCPPEANGLCSYPANCPTGCSTQCVSYYRVSADTPLVCGNTVTTCGGDTSRNYWEPQVQGCTSAVPLPAYITFMIGQDEIGTQAQIDAEAKFQRICNGVGVDTTPNSTKVPLGEPFVCDIKCTSTQAINVDTCSCMNAVAPPKSGGIPWYVYVGIGVAVIAGLFIFLRPKPNG